MGKKILTLSLSILVFVSCVFAQEDTPDKKEVETSRGRPMIVQIEVPNSKVIEKLKKKGKDNAVAIYIKALDNYNSTIKAASDKYWKINQPVLYKTLEAIKELHDQSSKEYVVLRCVTSILTAGDGGGERGIKYSDHLEWSFTEIKNENSEDDLEYWKGNTVLEFFRIEKMNEGVFNKHDVIGRISLPEIFPDTASLVYGLQMLQYYMNQAGEHLKSSEANQLVKQNLVSLKTKTIYIRQDRLDVSLNVTAIKKIYAYPVKIVSSREYETAIMNGEEGTAFLLIASPTPYLKSQYAYVFDPSQGKTLAIIAPSVGSLLMSGGEITEGYVVGAKGKPMVQDRVLEWLGKYVANADR